MGIEGLGVCDCLSTLGRAEVCVEGPTGLRGAAFGLKFDFFLIVNDIGAGGRSFYVGRVVAET